MSQELINRSADLKRLRNEGYEVEISGGYLIVHHIPYVNDSKQVACGKLVSTLNLSGVSTAKPDTHVALWVGEFPCDSNGVQLTDLVNGSEKKPISNGLVTDYSFSQKPRDGYADYYQKMASYIAILTNQAKAIKPEVTATTFPSIPLTTEESVFCYLDTASSRSEISHISEKLKDKIAVVGLGGTGAYVLDLVAKTPVREIHLFDGDAFLQHNAFRSPGAPSLNDLSKKQAKVNWFTEIYSRMRRKIIPHPYSVNDSNMSELDSMDFVFICIDNGKSRQDMVDHLVENKIPFIDTGIGICSESGSLIGSARITTCIPVSHVDVVKRIPFDDVKDDEYSTNIQIADLNALTATLAVIKWKKIRGFYHDFECEHNAVYGIEINIITNDEGVNEAGQNQARVY